jgi:hypothetical protein
LKIVDNKDLLDDKGLLDNKGKAFPDMANALQQTLIESLSQLNHAGVIIAIYNFSIGTTWQKMEGILKLG